MVNNVIKWKDTTETGEVEVIFVAVPWVSWGDLRHATSVFFVCFLPTCRCLAIKTQLFKSVFIFCGVLADVRGEDLF